jgi:hypothetical protein
MVSDLATARRVAGAEFMKAEKLSESLPEDTARRLADQSEEGEAVEDMESVVSGNDVNHTARKRTPTRADRPHSVPPRSTV